MREIKFYSRNDLASGFVLKEIENYLTEDRAEKEKLNINDLIEIYNIKQYFEHKLYLLTWTSNEIEKYEKQVNTYFKQVGRFFHFINSENLADFYNELEIEYREDFWALFEKFKVYERIADLSFNHFLNENNIWLYQLLRHKTLVQHFGNVIKEYMLSDHSVAELLLDEYEIQHTIDKEKLIFPKELTFLEKEKIILNYINSESPNLNYLRLIVNVQSNKDKIVLSPRTILTAKKRVEKEEERLFPENSGMLVETTVGFSKNQEEIVISNIDGLSIKTMYSKKWLENNKDYGTLLNNFIYLFEFVDFQMRCNFVNKPNQMGVMERMLYSRSRNAYLTGMAFNQMDMLSLLQIHGYYKELFSLGVRLELVIEWFFKEYLSKEFLVSNFDINMPSTHSTLLEKCTNIMPAVESVLKQFMLYVEEGTVDFELLEIRSDHLIYSNIPSLVNKKYAYGKGEEFNYASVLFFSDQSGLRYNEKNQNSYNNFFELLCNKPLKLADYPEYCHNKIEWLVEKKYLKNDDEGFIIFEDAAVVLVMKDLYFNEVVNYWRVSLKMRNALDKLETKNVVVFESSLLSKPEQEYVNYTLNKSQFNNGLDLRNRYSHTQPKGTENDNTHEYNYMIFLRLLILFMIKINDDFCLADMLSKREAK
ncbi:hypothetical protein [Paenibacillus sp. ACRRY]|uniref:hypothetical protein n=1 Tax=Paenibacillus sp. ACRRY TaxID=2918208 RepID=UPI001EF49337|nr:hypothetical protein [Paenibacillus sp. ACRRY]MCG7385597.1 hypothetical protein [Paenibacillus sp. ACRRY]